MAEQQVTLQPGESKVVSFEATPSQARVYQISVNGLTGSFVASPRPVARFEYVSDLRKSFFEVRTIWGWANAVKYDIDIQNQGEAPGVCSVKFHQNMWEPGYPLPPDPLDPASNRHWGGWKNMDFTHRYYVNPAYDGGRKDDFTSVLEAELAPGEIKTFWDSVTMPPYQYKDRVIGIKAAAALGEIVVMR